MRLQAILIFSFILVFSSLFAQTSGDDIAASYSARKKMAEQSILKNYPARNIGPVVQGGRIVDIDVNPRNTKEFYVGYASGGIFKTTNNGITFEPVFDHQDALGIGDFAIAPSNPNVLYVGTGEKNSSRSSYAGSGVYKTTDGGRTWTNLGLTGTHHIGRVIVHPQDENTVWVAAIGALYTHSADRGVFKTTDGGKTWKKTLFINDSTGVIDLVINPQNPQQLWAASWERTRKAWDFKGNGVHSSIYRSDDGGETWVKSVDGLPQGKQVGRIGLEVAPSNPRVVYAIIDNQGELEKKEEDKPGDALKLEDFSKMTKEALLKLDDKKLDDFLRNNRFPQKYTARVVKKDIEEGKYRPQDIASYFSGDANASLRSVGVIGAEVYRSDDGGATWKKMNSYDLEGVFFTYGYYFAEMKVSPNDPDLVYIYGVPLLKSRDGGVTWHHLDTLQGRQELHVDHHALWINPNDPQHILLGNDGGLYQSYDEGANWLHINNMPVGQFYTVTVDWETPYNVYGGMQDNGVWKGSSKSVPNITRPWESLMGGDGMFVAVDPRNSGLVYTGFQFGNYFRLERGKRTRITPQHDIGEKPLRWNWRSPLIMSKHNPDILYIAANKVYRSLNKGDNWELISPDLTKNRRQGNVPFSTISSLAESPLKFGLLYAGTDDGNVWVSKDAGGNWERINEGLPQDKWVSSVFPSPHDEATVFVSLNGYRDDDFKTYLFMSNDYGKTWKSINGNLPASVANVIIQDPVNESLLYCGLDYGTYVSLDRGDTWHLFNRMLNVASYDMLVHPRDNELVVATHGRSIFVADVKPLQALKGDNLKKTIVAFAPESIRHSERWGKSQYPWAKPVYPSLEVLYYLSRPSSEVMVEVYNSKNELVRKMKAVNTPGFNTWKWDVKVESAAGKEKKGKASKTSEGLVYAAKGKYTIRFISGADRSEVSVEIK